MRSVVARSKVDPASVEDVFFGCANQAGEDNRNVARLALLLAGLADRSLLIREATEDRLHQDYRSPLFPEAPQLLSRLVAAGALVSCWSGAGPALLGVCDGEDGERVRAGAEAAMEDIGIAGRALLLRADVDGLIVEDGPFGTGRHVASFTA